MKKFTLLFLFFVSWSSFTLAQDAVYQSKSEQHSREKKLQITKGTRTNIISKSFDKSNSNSVFYEGFENWDSQNPGKLPVGWTQFRTNTLNSNPTQQPDNKPWELINPDSNVNGDYYVQSGKGSMFISWSAGNESALGKYTWAVTPTFTVTGGANDYAYLTYYKWFQHDTDEGWFSSYHVRIFADGIWKNLASFAGPNDEANLYDDFVALELSSYINKSVKIAFVYEYTDGFEMAIDEIDVMILLNHDNGIASVAYDFFQWWPLSVNKTMGFEVKVNGMGQVPIEGIASLYVNNQLQDTVHLEALLFGMNSFEVLEWTPTTHGTFTIRIQLSNEVKDADGATVPDQNLTNNVFEFEIFIRDPQIVFFSEGFEHVDWDNPDGAVVIFPPSDNWSITEGWGATVSRSIRDLVSAAVYQVKDEAPELLVTPSLNLPAGKYILEMLVGGLNNGITDEDDVYFGHSILKVYITTELAGKSVHAETLLLTHSLEGGDATKLISLNLEIAASDEYYLKFETTSTFSHENFASGVFIDNIYLYKSGEVSVNESDFKQKLVLYPNPVRETLIIDNNEIINNIRIFDITGRVVYSNTVNDLNHQINVSEFTKGIYVLQVVSGNEIISRKFNVVK